LNGTLNELRRLVASEEFGALPGSLNSTLRELESTLESIAPESRTINELNRTLQSLDSLLRTLDEKPNSLIFKKPVRPDPEPGRGR
jgi:paraquat-inducible protein B